MIVELDQLPAVLPIARMARRVGATQQFLRDLVEAGELPGLPAGGKNILFHPETVERRLAELAQRQTVSGDDPTNPVTAAGK